MTSSSHLHGFALTSGLVSVLLAGSVVVAILWAFVASENESQTDEQRYHAQRQAEGERLARRAAPLLERSEHDAVASLATTTADIAGCRVFVLDAIGRVLVDSGRSMIGRELLLETDDGSTLRDLDGGMWELMVPVLGATGNVGEVRIRYRVPVRDPADLWELFALALLACASLVGIGWWLAHVWTVQIREITGRARAHGGSRSGRRPSGGLRELRESVERLIDTSIERSVQMEAGFLELADYVVKGLERRGLTVVGHGERTRRYARVLAAAVGADEATEHAADVAARVIDLGKAGVRPSALEKSSGLDDTERESLRQYPVRGANLLELVPGFQLAAAAMRHHREKYDGSGYPHGLRGACIPLAARILAIADAYDLLTRGSPDDVGRSWPDALDKLHDGRGIHFDPQLLDAFEAEIRRAPIPQSSQTPMLISDLREVPYEAGDEPVDQGEISDDAMFSVGDVELELLNEPPDDEEPS